MILFLYRFNRTTVVGEENIKDLKSYIIVSWHGKILGFMEHFKHRGYYALVSQSGDGDTIVSIAKRYGYKFFRGSSNRGGKEAMKEMGSFFTENPNAKLVITPDGPTGPEHKVKPGALLLAKKSQRPIVPVIVDLGSSWKFKNWHTFYLSRPFSKMRVVIGKPLYFDQNFNIEEGLKIIEDELKASDLEASKHA